MCFESNKISCILTVQFSEIGNKNIPPIPKVELITDTTRRFLTIIFALMTLTSCEKDDIIIPVNSIAEDLKLVISQEGVEALQICCEGCTCTQSTGWGTDYSFPGDNFVRVRKGYYNLNRLIRYEIETVELGGSTEKRMVLYFPL